MSAQTDVAGAVQDMLKVEREAVTKLREDISAQREALAAGIAEVKEVTGLLKEMVAEYDRLTQEMSTAVEACWEFLDQLKKMY